MLSATEQQEGSFESFNYQKEIYFSCVSMLRTKCIFLPISPYDGQRISVMSRHTLNDGVTPDSRIVAGVTYTSHLQKLAPPASLVGWWYRENRKLTDTPELNTNKMKDELWRVFINQYSEHLDKPTQAELTTRLVDRALIKTVTILCVEESPEFCHRRLLSEKAKLLRPELEVRHV